MHSKTFHISEKILPISRYSQASNLITIPWDYPLKVLSSEMDPAEIRLIR